MNTTISVMIYCDDCRLEAWAEWDAMPRIGERVILWSPDGETPLAFPVDGVEHDPRVGVVTVHLRNWSPAIAAAHGPARQFLEAVRDDMIKHVEDDEPREHWRPMRLHVAGEMVWEG